VIQVVLGVDIGGTNTVLGLIDQDGHIHYSETILTKGDQPFSDFICRFSSTVENALLTHPKLKLIGIGIGAPNGNHYNGVIQSPPNLSWGDVHITNEFESKFNCPVILTNDANAAALGEKYFGVAKDLNDFILITLGTGLGSGIFTGGNIVYGHDGMAGELGHLSIDINGRQCSCGLKGCLEMYVSSKGIIETIRQFKKENLSDEFLSSLDQNDINGKVLDDAFDAGIESAIDIYTFTGNKLGFGLAQAANLFSPSAFIFYGGYSQAGHRLLAPAKIAMDQYLMENLKHKIQLIPSGLPEGKAGILGAVSLIWETQLTTFDKGVSV